MRAGGDRRRPRLASKDTEGQVRLAGDASALEAGTRELAQERVAREIAIPDAVLGHAANFLYMLTGERPSSLATRAFDVALTVQVTDRYLPPDDARISAVAASKSGAPFERFFGVPHGIGFKSAAQLFGLSYSAPQTMKGLEDILTNWWQQGKTGILEVRTDRKENHDFHQKLYVAIKTALDRRRS